MKHPAVAMSAVVGIPDPIRTESIKAWIVLRSRLYARDAAGARDPGFCKSAASRRMSIRGCAIRGDVADDRGTARCCGANCAALG